MNSAAMNERMSDKQLDAYCMAWLLWRDTRRFYVNPGAQNILARMQPTKVGEPPDARNSAEMQFFNAAVYAMADMKEHEELFQCFMLMYFDHAGYIKELLHNQNISRKTYYNRARTFIRKAMSLARSFQVAQQSFDKENLAASV